MSADKVREIMKISQDPVSLEMPIGEEEDSHLGDFIEDDTTPAPADAAAQRLLHEQLNEVLHTLTPREEQVLKLRFGLMDGRPRTLEEVRKGISHHKGAYPSDRGESASQTAPSEPLKET